MSAGSTKLICDLGGKPNGLVHVGAHFGQELAEYRDAGLRPVVYIEALPKTYDVLVRTVDPLPGHIPVNALCAEEDGHIVEFRVSSNEGASSSMLDFGWCPDEHPEVTWVDMVSLTTKRLDTVMADLKRDLPDLPWATVNVLVLDAQGTELRILAGAPELLNQVDWVYTEVNEGGLYAGDCSLDDVYSFMRERGFRMKHLEMNRHRWGDALFARDRALDKTIAARPVVEQPKARLWAPELRL